MFFNPVEFFDIAIYFQFYFIYSNWRIHMSEWDSQRRTAFQLKSKVFESQQNRNAALTVIMVRYSLVYALPSQIAIAISQFKRYCNICTFAQITRKM